MSDRDQSENRGRSDKATVLSYEEMADVLTVAEELEWQATLLRAQIRLGSPSLALSSPSHLEDVRSGLRPRLATLAVAEVLILAAIAIGFGLYAVLEPYSLQIRILLALVPSMLAVVCAVFLLAAQRSREFQRALFEKEAEFRLSLAHEMVRPMQENFDIVADRLDWPQHQRDLIYVRLSRFSLGADKWKKK